MVRKLRLGGGVKETRRAIKKVTHELVKEKHKNREEQNEKLREELELRKMEEKAQQTIRDELIRKIRELDKRIIKKSKGFDPTETAGLGLLEEMSLYELNEKIEIMKEEKRVEEERSRAEILNCKRDKEVKNREITEQIMQARQVRHHENNQKRVEKKKKLDDRAKREEETYREQTKLAHQKIVKKKEDFKREDEIIQKKAREIKLKKQYLKANQAKVEEQAWKNQEDGAEREIKERQNDS